MRRRAYTLIEMLVAIFATSIILGTTLLTVRATIRISDGIRDGIDHQYSLDRLTDRFRGDVRASRSADIPAIEPAELHLSMADGTRIVYRFSESGVVRRVLKQESPVHEDQWTLDSAYSVRWIGEGNNTDRSAIGPTVVWMVVLRQDELGGQPLEKERVFASIGWDLRYDPDHGE